MVGQALTHPNLQQLVAAGLSDAEIGDRLGVCARTVLRWRHEAGLRSMWTSPLGPHGSLRRYRQGCACAACRGANAAAERQRYRRRAYASWRGRKEACSA